VKSCLSQRGTKITYCVSCPLCFSIRKIKTSVRWFISPRSRCRTWNRFILPLIPRSCTISYIFSRSLIWLTRKHMLIYQLSASAPRKILNPVALHMDHMIWYTVRLGCKPSQNEKKNIFGIKRKNLTRWALKFGLQTICSFFFEWFTLPTVQMYVLGTL